MSDGKDITIAVVPDFWNLAAVKLRGMPEGWVWGKLNSHDKPEDFVEVQGAVPEGVYKSGPRKGRPKYPKTLQTIWIRRSEIERLRREWELSTGVCSTCKGTGQVCYSTSIGGMRQCRKCHVCGGTGSPKNDCGPP